MPTIREVLDAARAAGVDRLDAQWLIGHRLGRDRAWLLAHDDEALSPADAQACAHGLARRAAGEPLAYVTGETTFRGLRLGVGPEVLIPRPETEVLIEWALAVGPHAGEAIDLGTGSGAIALAMAREAPALRVTATDLSAAALSRARANAAALGLSVDFHLGPWWAAVPGRRFALAVSNPPYVAAGDPHLAALRHEPDLALTPGGDGLAALRDIVGGAHRHLDAGAWLLLEHGHDQAAEVGALLRAAGFAGVQTRADLAGLPRCTGGQWRRVNI